MELVFNDVLSHIQLISTIILLYRLNKTEIDVLMPVIVQNAFCEYNSDTLVAG